MTVEKEWELLGVILTRLTEQYEKYRVLLQAQRKAVVANQVQELVTLSSEMEIVNENISRLNVRRVGHMNALSSYAGKEILNIKELIVIFPQLDGEWLQQRATALKSVVADVQKITQTNVDLLELSRKVVQVTLQTILGQNTDPRDKAWRTYGAAGSYARTIRREPVNLVNRRG